MIWQPEDTFPAHSGSATKWQARVATRSALTSRGVTCHQLQVSEYTAGLEVSHSHHLPASIDYPVRLRIIRHHQ